MSQLATKQIDTISHYKPYENTPYNIETEYNHACDHLICIHTVLKYIMQEVSCQMIIFITINVDIGLFCMVSI